MTVYRFKKERDTENEFDKTDVEITAYTENRDELLEAFKEFLLACGFYVKGEIEVVEDENETDN